VSRRDVERQLLDEASQPGSLAFRQVEDKPCERGGVDDWMLQRAFESPAHEPCVERIVAVLDENGALRKAQKGPARVTKLRRADQHRTVDVMSLLGVWIDWCAAVDECVEERERARQLESLRAQLQDQEGRVACRLDVDGDELRIVEGRLRPELGRVDCNLLPGNWLRRSARLEEDGFHEGRLSRADLMNSISSRDIALSRRTAAP
jgi:hypothetical protein